MLSETVSAGVSPHLLLQGKNESSKREETHLGSLFVSALSQTSESAPWKSLLSYLKSQTKTELESLIEQSEVQHYIHRAVRYAIKHSERVKHLGVLDELSSLFPEAVKQYTQTELPYSYSYSNVEKNNEKAKKKSHKRSATTPIELFEYAPQNLPATFRGTQLKLADLVPASYQVNDEISMVQKKMHHEAQRGTSRGEELREVARLGRPLVSHGVRLKRSRSVERSMLLQASAQKPMLNPILSSSVDDAHFHKLTAETLFPRATSPSKAASAVRPVSTPGQLHLSDGYQTIEAFASGKLKSESESIYLNYADPFRRNPYNLVVVSKTKADPEHFVVSKFGILCVYPDGTSDLQSFAEWLREASLFQMLRQIPFLKYYRLTKAFTQWYQNIRFAQFACVHSKFKQIGLRYFATFGQAVLKINNLSQELLSIPFHSLQPLGAYSSDSYMHCLKGSQAKFQQFLHRYFKYCKRVVGEVVESTQNQAVELEMELRHQPFVSDLPLSVQKEKHLKLGREFEEISYQASRLSDFVSLAEHIVFSCLLAVAHQGTLGWRHSTLGQSKRERWSNHMYDAYDQSQSSVRRSDSSMATSEENFDILDERPVSSNTTGDTDAMLCVSIIIKESGEISTEPSVSEVKQLLLCPLHMIAQSLTSCVQPLTGVKPSRPATNATSTLVNGTEASTPMHVENSPVKKSSEVKQKISPVREAKSEAVISPRPVPPSMVPARQPKSLLRALKGSVVGPSTRVGGVEGREEREGKQERHMLESERARSQLATATSGDDTATLRGDVQSTQLLKKEHFSAIIRKDEVLIAVNNSLERAVDEACETITSICEENQWLSDVWRFVNSWQGRSKVTSLSAEELEKTFNCLYDWQCLLECLPVQQCSPHSLVSIGSGEVVGRLLPRLTTILEQVKSIGVLQAKMLCERVLQQTKHKTEMLTSKRYDLEGFAEYAHHLSDCQTFHKSEAKHIDYVLRVHSTLRRNGVKVPQEDEDLSEELRTVWHTFEGVLREAEQFVTTQTPMKAQGLQQSIEAYEEELGKFVQQVNEGQFIDPNGNPLLLLEELKQILEEAYSMRSRLLGLSKWKEAISGKPHDLSRVFRLMDQIVTRQEVWKYRKVFDGYERDWLKVPFKKLDIGLISEKVTIWLEMCNKLEESLPCGDPVLVGWKQRLCEFQQGFPLLQQLASKALKVSHWYTIFASLGEDFDPSHQYTLNDFQFYNIYEHSNIIFEICHDAMQQEKLRGKVDKMQSRLEQETLTVSQSPVDRYPFAVASSSPLPSSTQERDPRSTKQVGIHLTTNTSTNATTSTGTKSATSTGVKTTISAKKHGEKITSFAVGFPPPSPSAGGVECLLFIDNEQDILLGLENDIISVKILLASPHLGGLRTRAEALMKTLLQLKELMGLLSQCQDQWRQLLSLFSNINPSQLQAYGISELQEATAKYQEVVKSVQDDSRLLSLLGKRRGQKGFRELQGDALRQCCNKIQAYLETAHTRVKGELDRGCSQFPRLCFLGDRDVLRVLSHSGNPVTIMQQIRGVFPAVRTVRFAEVLPSNSPAHQTHHDSKEGFQLMGVDGWCGEHLSLVAPLSLGKRPAPQWLHGLEAALSYSLGSALAECHSTLPDSLVGTGNTEQQGDDIEHWVGCSLSQTVLLSLEMRWTSELYSALTSDNPVQQLRHISSKLHAVLDTMAELLRSEREAESAIKCQLSFQNIITVLSHKLAIAKSLIEKRALTPESFEWRHHILYASDSNTIYNSVQKDRSQPSNNHLSVDYNRMSMASFRGSITSIYSSHHSLKAGSSNAKLQGSTHSLVASSKSLLSSRNALLAAAGGSDLQKSGTSSLVLYREPQPPMKCFVHCGESILPYGFEYHGPKAKLVLSPVSESCMLLMMNELARFTVPSLRGATLSGKTETGIEVARLLGRQYYQFSCSPSSKLSTLHHLVGGALQAGSMLLLQASTTLQPHIVASLGEWLATLMMAVAKAFSGKQSSIIFPSHSHQKNISDGRSTTSTFSAPSQSRTSTSMLQSHPTDKTTPLSKSTLLRHATTRTPSVIKSKQQLLTEVHSRQGSRQGMASRQGNTKDTTKEASISEVRDVLVSQSPSASQHSPSRTQHHHTAASSQPPASSSQPATRIDWYRLCEGQQQQQPSDSQSSISKPEWFGYGGGPRINVEVFDQLLQISPGFSCVFVGESCRSTMKEIPESFKCVLRPISVVAPDCVRISEALLLSYGFTEAGTLSWSLAQVLDCLKCQLSSSNPEVASSISSMVTLKQIIGRSFDLLTSKKLTDSMDIPQAECDALAQATLQHFHNQLMCQDEGERGEEMDEVEGHVSVNMDPMNWSKLNEIIGVYFPGSAMITDGDGSDSGVAGVKTELAEAIKTQLKEHHLQDLPMFQEKIFQLHRSLQRGGSRCVVLSGVSGSGKTTSYRSLAGAYHYIRELRALGKQSNNNSKKGSLSHRTTGSNNTVAGSDDYPCVDITVINPAVYTLKELFGCYGADGPGSTTPAGDGVVQSSWRDGILTRLFKQMDTLENLKMLNKHPDMDSMQNTTHVPMELEQVNHWVVLDGPLEPGVVAALEMLVKGEGLTLTNGDTLLLPRSCWLILESPKLTHFTPSLLSHSSLVHFSRDILSYEAIVDTWLDRAPTQHNLSAMSTETLATMIKQLLPETLNYLHQTNTRCLGALYSTWVDSQVYGVTETQCFTNLLSAVLERNAPKVDSAFTHTGTASISSRLSGSRIDSRASSAMLSTYSTTSMRVDSSFSSALMPTVDSIADVHDHADMCAVDELSECSDLDAQLNLSMQLQMAAMLSFAYIWSLGAFVPFSELDSFSEFARDQIMQLPFMVPLPEEGSVFDYFLNLKQYQFIPWSQRGVEPGSSSKGVIKSSGYVPLPEVERFAYIVDLYLSYGLDVMIVGQRGTGKTSFVENLVQSRVPVTKLQMSPTLSPRQLQGFILERVAQLERRGGQRIVGGGGRGATKLSSSMRSTFFLDDIHLASNTFQTADSDREGEVCIECSPVLELARFAIQHHHLIDVSRSYSHSLNNVKYIGSCTPWEYWKLPHQLSSSFNLVPFLPPSDHTLHHVFSTSILQWLQQFPDSAFGGDPHPLAEALSAASVAVYRSVSGKFHPSPSAPYLLFTMHDLLHVYEGLLLRSPSTKAQAQPQFGLMNRRGFLSSTQTDKTPKKRSNPKLKTSGRKGSITLPSLKNAESLGLRRRSTFATVPTMDKGDENEMVSTMRMVIRLWCHESTRVYMDRTTDSRERVWFLKLLETCIKYSFCGIDFKDAQKPSSQRQFGGQTGGGRRVRGGRGRVSQTSSSSPSMEGPSLEELISTGMRVDTLKQLMARKEMEDNAEDSSGDEGKVKKLIALDQVTLRGEDLTSLIFAQFPSKSCQPTGTSSRESVSSEEGERTTEAKGSAPTTQTTAGINSYSELGDGQVMEILAKHLTGCSSDSANTQQQWEGNADSALYRSRDLVLFKGAIEHAARLCRVMNLPGSHSLLIGAKGSGRRSLITLIAHIVNAKLFYLSESRLNNKSLRQQLRDICISAAVDGQPTVLVISSSIDIRRQDWEDVYKLMNEGLCPGLFTSSELLVMSSKMQTGRVKKTVEGAHQTFARAVRRQLHVFVLWDTSTDSRTGTGSLFSGSSHQPSQASLERELVKEEASRLCFTSLYRACSYIDVYQPWSKQDYCDIALSWWQRGVDGVRWQDWVDTSSHLEAVGNLAAHVHITTSELLRGSYAPGLGSISDLVSPQTFIDCLKMTKNLAMEIKKNEQDDADKLRRALDKLSAIDHTVKELEYQLATLQPRLANAEQEVQQKMALITAAKERYMAANRRCKFAEDTIQTETENVEQLSKLVEEKFNEVSPVYHSALEALISVQKNDILELMSYREPPDMLTPVFNALCMLFDREQTWEDCKQLLLTPKFFESLKFFDRDSVPLRKLRRLEKMINRHAKFEDLDQGSQAIVPVCTWLIALVDYHYAKMTVQPYRDRLQEAERTLMDANKTFVEMKKDMMETRTALENTVKLHKESVHKQRSIEAEITSIQSKLESARHLLSTISSQRARWDANLRVIHAQINSVPGHALLCAASVCYLARTPPDTHRQLLSNWLGYCSGAVSLGSLAGEHGGLQAAQGHQSYSSQKHEVVKVQRDFSVSAHLSEKEERSHWRQESVFPDQTSLERFLAARSTCNSRDNHWPFIFDPHQQFESYLSALNFKTATNDGSKEVISVGESVISVKSPNAHYHHKALLKLKLFEPNFHAKLESSLQEGNTVLVYMDTERLLHTEESPPNNCKEELGFISKVLQRKFSQTSDSHGSIIESQHGPITIHPDFQLYLISNKHLEDFLCQGLHCFSVFQWELSAFCVVNMALSPEGMQSHFQRFIITHEKPEYKIRYKSLLTDLTLHQQQLTDSQEKVLQCVLESDDLLVQATPLQNTVKESESLESSALEQITDTEKSMQRFDQQALAYRPLSEMASIILTAIQKLSSTLKYFTFGIDELEGVIVRLITRRKDNKVADDAMAVNANVLYLKNQLLLSVQKILQVYMFRRHQILLPFMVAVELLVGEGKMTPKEYQLLSMDLGGLDTQIDSKLRENKGQEGNDTPVWISRKTWCQLLQLEAQVPTFHRLSKEISMYSAEWKEYFDAAPYLLGPVPVYFDDCTLGQKLLLWKTFRPEKLSKVCEDFVVMILGAGLSTPWSLSVNLLLPHSSPQVPILCMLPPTSACSASKPNPVVLLETAASQMKRKFHLFALLNEEDSDDLTVELSQLACEDCWVVVEDCHLYSNWQLVLKQVVQLLYELSKGEDRLHPDFRMWLLLPFDAVDSDFSIDCFKVAFDYNDISGPQMSVLRSKEFSDDLKLLYTPQSSTHRKWEEYDPLLLKLLSFIPPTLPYSKLTELDPQLETTQSLSSLLYEELCIHNSSIMQLQASLRELFTFTGGDALFTSQAGLALKSIRSNHIPTAWKSLLPFPSGQCPELLPALNLLKYRIEFYTRALESGSDCLLTEVRPHLFSNPQDMISRILQTSPNGSQIHTKLLIEGFSVHHNTDSDVPSIILSDLYLHGARWDRQTEQLSPLSEGEDTGSTRCSILITLKPPDFENTTTNTVCAAYNCPLLLVTSGSVRDATVQSAPKLCSLPLPCSPNWEQVSRTRCHSQEGQSTHPELLLGDNCPKVYLTCEWPT